MVVVASIWEDGWNTPIKEADLWYYPMKEFGVDEIAMTPVSGIRHKIKEFHSVEDIIHHYGLPIIICDEQGDNVLGEFKHPEEALYLFSRTSRSLYGQYKDTFQTLRIETPKNKAMLWGHQAASIIMYDRWQSQL